ncbi:hypothetical protein [Frankia gtarii]|uniref:hypothetical protein n=1 Tax=Frankia gtarii TaxID=2950102 RepID=UPI0021BF8A81|nr:hypothetical protein [Frankia gtarii]
MEKIDSGDAFERILSQSEKRLDEVHEWRSRLGIARRAQVAAGSVALVAVAVALLGPNRSSSGQGTWIALALLTAAAALGVSFAIQVRRVNPLGRQVAIKERAVLNDVNRLRELFIYISQRENWGDERIRNTKSRLSKFSIGSGAIG